jgi:hypothetical protein
VSRKKHHLRNSCALEICHANAVEDIFSSISQPQGGRPHDRSRQVHGLVGQVILDINRELGVLTNVMSGANDRKPTKKHHLMPYN